MPPSCLFRLGSKPLQRASLAQFHPLLVPTGGQPPPSPVLFGTRMYAVKFRAKELAPILLGFGVGPPRNVPNLLETRAFGARGNWVVPEPLLPAFSNPCSTPERTASESPRQGYGQGPWLTALPLPWSDNFCPQASSTCRSAAKQAESFPSLRRNSDQGFVHGRILSMLRQAKSKLTTWRVMCAWYGYLKWPPLLGTNGQIHARAVIMPAETPSSPSILSVPCLTESGRVQLVLLLDGGINMVVEVLARIEQERRNCAWTATSVTDTRSMPTRWGMYCVCAEGMRHE